MVYPSAKKMVVLETGESTSGEVAERVVARASAAKDTSSTDMVHHMIALSKKNHMPLLEVRERREEWAKLDTENKGFILLPELKTFIRKSCGIPASEPVPSYLLQRVSAQKQDNITFEDFLEWSRSTAYMEDLVVPDEKERSLRQLARENGLLIPEVEKVQRVFEKFDADGSGAIDEEEFSNVIRDLMKVKNPSDISYQMLKRYWREIDSDGSGEVCFEEFLLWYFKFMATEVKK